MEPEQMDPELERRLAQHEKGWNGLDEANKAAQTLVLDLQHTHKGTGAALDALVFAVDEFLVMRSNQRFKALETAFNVYKAEAIAKKASPAIAPVVHKRAIPYICGVCSGRGEQVGGADCWTCDSKGILWFAEGEYSKG